jgi:hypothetical protein
VVERAPFVMFREKQVRVNTEIEDGFHAAHIVISKGKA